MTRFVLPLALFLALVSTLALGLKRSDPQDIPSALVGKPTPAFVLNQLENSSEPFRPGQLKGQVWLLNVWASWCTSCRQEHSLLVSFGKQGVVSIIGLNYQDEREAARQWLSAHGDPYQLTAFDADGRVGMDLGVIGVPETFVIDQQGRIRQKFSGPLTPTLLKEQVLPLIKALQHG